MERRSDLVWICLAGAMFLLLVFAYFPISGLWQNTSAQTQVYLLAALPGSIAALLLRRHWIIAPSGVALALVLLLGLLPRLLFAIEAPSLSDDIYRYLWDGRVMLADENVYAHPPSHPSLAELAGRFHYHHRINHPEFSTVYPPAAILLFAVSATFANPATQLAVLSLIFLGFELLLFLFLWRKTSRPVAVLYWISAVPIIEFCGSGHVDVAAVALLVAAATFTSPILVGALLAPSILLKPYGLLLFPFVCSRRSFAAAGIVGLILIAPFSTDLADLVRNLGAFSDKLMFNAGPLALMQAGLQKAGLSWASALAWSTRLVGLSSLLLMALLFRRKVEPMLATYYLLSFGLFFSSQVHPWYWLVVAIVGLCSFRYAWWITMPLVLTSYFTYERWQSEAVWEESVGWRVITFSSLLVMMILEERPWSALQPSSS